MCLGYYHCSAMVASLLALSRSTGVWIDRYSFSEPQAGKGPCDRMAAYMKRRVRDHLDRNHDVGEGKTLRSENLKEMLEKRPYSFNIPAVHAQRILSEKSMLNFGFGRAI